MRILCDTHTLIWLLEDNPKLTDKVRRIVSAPDAELFFSSVSILEIAIKHSQNPEQMPCSPDSVLDLAVASNFREVGFKSAHAKMFCALPWLHRDPFDRMLIAQARIENMELLSHDSDVLKYGASTIGF